MIEAEITGTPKLHDSVVDKEYAAAKKEGRQPNCPYCGEPLEVWLREDGITCWVWMKKQGALTSRAALQTHHIVHAAYTRTGISLTMTSWSSNHDGRPRRLRTVD
jgi:hypothetical protein